ncbi:MAG: guanylate kinase [Lachnospiraceae bacterium]|jgi:guanylate kinase|nr:guanylate kinase [Lachnospiraceae bacterium]
MGQIFYLMGKSSSGKDTLYRKLTQENPYGLESIVSYTTRPIRGEEKEGREYHFVSVDAFERLKSTGKVIEYRAYNTVHGIWYYFLADDGQIELDKKSYLLIGTLEGYESLIGYFGKDAIVPIYLEVDDGVRLQRALDREKTQPSPKYAELCRRYLADQEDFSEERLAKDGITVRFNNENVEETCRNILDYIGGFGNGHKD